MQETKPIMLNLKESTKSLHDSTEQHEFQKVLGTGKISKPDYIKYMEQLHSIHNKLAEELDRNQGNEKIASVVKERHLCTASIEDDIEFLGAKKNNAIEACQKFLKKVDETSKENPVSLLGILYVLEGSTHGAKYMASNLRKGLNLPERKGSSYFDRYESEQMNLWLSFKQDMNDLTLNEEEEEKIIEAARETFRAFSEIGAEIIAASKQPSAS